MAGIDEKRRDIEEVILRFIKGRDSLFKEE
jgi:hypothetical protein